MYYGSDPGYLVWLEGLLDRIHVSKKAQQKQEERALKGKK